MKQVWLRTNRRIWLISAIVPAVVLVLGIFAAIDPWQVGWALRGPGIGIVVVGGVSLLAMALLAAQPRVAFENGKVLFYVRMGRATAIPIDVVECFLLGHGPVLLPGEQYAKTEASTVVVRLAERAEEWSHGEFHPVLAAWCDGYITLRGTWCEPLNVDVVTRLNRLLYEASQVRA